MHIMTTTTTLHTAARGEPIGVFDSDGENISPAPEPDSTAKNLVLPGRARCIGASRESWTMDVRKPHACQSSFERGVHDGHRDSFRAGCARPGHSWNGCRHRGNSNRARRCSFRSQDHTARRRQGLERTPPLNRPGVVVAIPRRIVLQNGRRVLIDSGLDDDPSCAQVPTLRVTGICFSSHGFSRKPD